MPKTIILTESQLGNLLSGQIIEESGLNKSEVADAVRDALKSNRDVNKDIEKKVKTLVAGAVNTLFKTLWQRHNFYEDEIKK